LTNVYPNNKNNKNNNKKKNNNKVKSKPLELRSRVKRDSRTVKSFNCQQGQVIDHFFESRLNNGQLMSW
jgi:hypothetical protein